jgi:hypothetical protein
VKDVVVVASMILAFALLVTVHVSLVFGLAGKTPRWRALVGLVVPPLAPFWGWRERMRKRAVMWLSCAVLYAVSLAFASF